MYIEQKIISSDNSYIVAKIKYRWYRCGIHNLLLHIHNFLLTFIYMYISSCPVFLDIEPTLYSAQFENGLVQCFNSFLFHFCMKCHITQA